MNPIVSDTCPINSVPYIIRLGDTIVKIASIYQTEPQAILDMNPRIDPYNLQIGHQICVPLMYQRYPLCPTTNYYVVQNGDTLDSIASYFNIPTLFILYANYGINPNELYEDQILCIPVSPPPVTLLITLDNQTLDIIGRNNHRFPIRFNSMTKPNQGTYSILNKVIEPGSGRGPRYLVLSKPGLGISGSDSTTNLSLTSDIILSNQDIIDLFNLVTVGTLVTIR